MGTENEPQGVVVTFKDMYNEMRDLLHEVKTLTQELKESRKTDEDHERRLRVLERWMYAIPATLFIAIASIITAIMKGP